MPLARTSSQYRPRWMHSSRRNRVLVSSEVPARIHDAFRHPKPLPNPHHSIQSSSPQLSPHNLNAEPLLRPCISASQPSQSLPRTSIIPYSNSITDPLHDAEVPSTRTPNSLRDAPTSLNLILGTDGEDASVPTPAKPVIQPHPLSICPRS